MRLADPVETRRWSIYETIAGLSVAVDYSVWWRIYHTIDIIYELKDELCLATARGSYHHGGEGMLQKEHSLLSVLLDFAKLCYHDSNYDGGQ